ncbi:MAG: arylamine N-acetyltransferase [Candidatus Stygibacter frigidus]|nr:arylamine N-acetyltransferase [Candidatus Stygibacter frigidus]
MEIAVFNIEQYRNIADKFLEHNGITDIKPDFRGLNQVLQAFRSIPYENVSKLIKYGRRYGYGEVEIRLPDTIWREYLESGLGGTCYSLTFFLETILANAGFTCYPVSADMKWGKDVHCGLVVMLDGVHWWCDPGYLLMTPLQLSGRKQQVYRTRSSGVILEYDRIKYSLITFNGRQKKRRYSFKDRVCNREKLLKLWLKSFERPGMNGICLTRQEREGMIYIHNNYFREVSRSGIKKNRMDGNWMKQIEKTFGIPENLLEEADSFSRERGKK